MALAIDIASWAFLIAGGAFCLVGSIGLLRLPDMFARLHGASVTDTLGAGLIVIGLILQAGVSLVSAKLVIVMGLILLTSPVATHALAQAALIAGVRPRLARDDAAPAGPAEDASSNS